MSDTCSQCSREYRNGEARPCPACGSSAVTHIGAGTGTIRILGGVRLRSTRDGFKLLEADRRYKRAGRSGKLAHEVLSFDHSDPLWTTKRHVVREEQEDGTWETVHDEREDYPAKRRRPQ